MEALEQTPESLRGDDGVTSFVDARPRMFAAALRTLGNASEAEDVVQDVWLRWHKVDRTGVRNAAAFLTTTSVRLAINRAVGARTRHETPLQLRHAEPVDHDAGPGARVEQNQAIESALLTLLEKLGPVERAAFVLREAFGYSYRQIAEFIRISEENCRQLVTRARKHLSERPSASVSRRELQRISVAFVEATRTGNLTDLEAVLAADIAACGRENRHETNGTPVKATTIGRIQ